MKCREILQMAKSELRDNGIPNFDSDCEFLLANLMGIGRCELRGDMEITHSIVSQYSELISRRARHEPMDSLIGFTEFMGLKIPFSVYTLSPRQETEIMVDSIVRENCQNHNLRILDMCTGSGCIGLALKKHLDAEVTLADISDEALKECRYNADINNTKVEIVKSDLFDSISGTFDIIVSNPPYIPSEDINELEKEVLEYDPIISLDGGEDGLDFYRKIIERAPKFLKDDGLIYLEFGVGQSEYIASLMRANFDNIEIVKDYSGLDRYIKGKKKRC